MSGKFMKIKRVFVPALTMLIIASQLAGCSAGSQSDITNMMDNQQEICIEVAVPNVEEQGERIEYEWKELASINTYAQLRGITDDILMITPFGDGGKNGTIYVDLEGNHTNNSTLYYAMMNKAFRNQLKDNLIMNEIKLGLNLTYVDLDDDEMRLPAFINAYFNIFADNEPNYFNGNSSITRGEFLGGLYRAANPVSDIQVNESFKNLTDPELKSENTIYASQLHEYSYLGLSDKSLNTQTIDGYITRAEAIYTIVKMYFNSDYEKVTGNEECFADAKNGGDIASKQKFNGKDYWASHELKYALTNPDDGMPDDLYKAMVVAKNKGLITDTECRWNEALTKEEAIQLIIDVYEALPTKTNVERGNAVGSVVENNQGSENTSGSENTNAEYNIFDHISEHCVRKFEYHKDENGKIVATNLSTMSDELKTAILELVPEFSNYPAEYQDKIFKSIAGNNTSYKSAEDIENRLQTSMNEYYKYGYNEEYGEVKGHENSKPETNQSTGNNQGETNNTQGGGNNQAPSAGSNDSGVTPQDPTRVYENKEEVTITLDGGTQIHFKNTGEYIDGKAVYEDADGNKCHIDVNGGVDLISSNDDWWKNTSVDENGANFTDHIRE